MQKQLFERQKLEKEIRDTQWEITKSYGKNIGEKIFYFLLRNYFCLKDDFSNEDEVIKMFKEETCIGGRVYRELKNGDNVSLEYLKRIAIGCMLYFIDAVAILELFGYSLLGPKDDEIITLLKKIENDELEGSSGYEKIINSGVSTKEALDKSLKVR